MKIIKLFVSASITLLMLGSTISSAANFIKSTKTQPKIYLHPILCHKKAKKKTSTQKYLKLKKKSTKKNKMRSVKKKNSKSASPQYRWKLPGGGVRIS